MLSPVHSWCRSACYVARVPVLYYASGSGNASLETLPFAEPRRSDSPVYHICHDKLSDDATLPHKAI